MKHTKIRDYGDGTFGLLVRNENGKYIQIGRAKKSVINRKREMIRTDSIHTEAELNKRTFVQVYEEFANDRVKTAEGPNALKYQSVKIYPSFFRRFIKPYFDETILIQNVNIDILETWFKKITPAKCGFKVAENVAKTIKTCMKYAIKKQYIRHLNGVDQWSVRENKALLPEDPKDFQAAKVPMINRHEVNSLLEHLKPLTNPNKDMDKFVVECQKYMAIATLAYLGLRISEMLALKWSDITFGEKVSTYELSQAKVSNTLYNSLKAEGSYQKNPIPYELDKRLKFWKAVHDKYFKGSKWVFPSTKDKHVSICEKTVRDWLLIAYAAIGLAEIEIIPCTNPKKNKSYIKVKWCKFKRAITKTFRHFAATVVVHEQAKNPAIFNDNFIKGYIRHKDVKLTKGRYGNHYNLDESDTLLEEQRKGLDKAFQLEK